ncbi:MAG: acetyl-CoA carboxylase biotin carboxylase subunit [Bradymonadaceae bacterium]|nr:acetyl-CoA carboxylase biotin carboxylase subunit [Lujinxingiaceae bacterium]
MFDRILIANRGEIAARIARTCKRLGIHSVAIFSEADRGAPHTLIADEAHCVGPAHVLESYLNVERILEVVKDSGAQAIHPGYGLLSENTSFVARVEAAGVSFIGPSSEAIRLMGDKAQARAFATSVGVPVVPGSDGPVADEEAALVIAEQLGYPVLVKASAGGGGIGMNLATDEKGLKKAIKQSQRRAESAFGNAEFYLERFVSKPRHIEVQVFGDAHGNVVHLFERECSIQRRHQKVIEETPSVAMGIHPGLRERMTEAAVRLTRAANYKNAGTIEFIVDDQGNFYFIEMNTRLQVEHTITEMITGTDLVEWQLRVAAGQALPLSQDEITMRGHAIQCRIYAENPAKMFMPAPGTIGDYVEPHGEGVRVDSGVQANWEVTPFYDPLVAKVVTHGESRTQAAERMRDALQSYRIDGLTTNKEMHLDVLADEDFLAGRFHTGWLEHR